MSKKLYRSSTDKKICGVCAGLGDYFGIDPTIIRLIWLFIALTGTGILVYIIAAIIIPEEPFYNNDEPSNTTYKDPNSN